MTAFYGKFGNSKYMIDEDIIQSSHALQAAYLASLSGAPEDIIIALLFHDIGQITFEEKVGEADFLHANHSEIGANWLKTKGFPPMVWGYAENHTLAKIFLCEEDPEYYTALSKASKASYHIQKNKYLHESANQKTSLFKKFLRDPNRKIYQVARKCDDMAKVIDFDVSTKGNDASLPNFENYREMTDRVLANEGRAPKDKNWMDNINQLHKKMTSNIHAFNEMIRNNSEIDFVSLKKENETTRTPSN